MLLNTKDFQDTLHELLDYRLKPRTKNEELIQKILNKSDDSSRNDFQEMLRKSIKPMNYDKTKKELEKNTKDIKNSDGENKSKVQPQAITTTNVEKVVNDIDKEESKEENFEPQNSENPTEQLTKREQALKQMYIAALEEYYTLREKLYKYQLKEDNIAVDDRSSLKLLQYETYLRKCDSLFKSSYGSFIANQDEEVSKIENKYTYETSKIENKLIDSHEKSISEIDSLNVEIENKANEIMKLNEEAEKGNVEFYEDKLNALEKEYIKLNAKMSMLKPNILELYRQEQLKDNQDITRDRVVGVMYHKRKEKTVYEANVLHEDKKLEKKEEEVEDLAKKPEKKLEESNIAVAQSYVKSADEAIERKDAETASKLVNKAKELVGEVKTEKMIDSEANKFAEVLKKDISSSKDDKKSINEEITDQTQEIDDHITETKANKENLSDFAVECIDAVYDVEERDSKVIKREKEDIEKEQREPEKEKEIEIIR